MPKPTKDEEKNGWTEESLTKYLKERDEALDIEREPPKPIEQNHRYNPKRWR